MGEDTFIYSAPLQSPYSPSFPVKTDDNPGLMPYNPIHSDPYCADPSKLTVMVGDKLFQHQDESMDEYHHDAAGRPQLHHMPSISTTCTSDSFQSPFPSAESGEVSAFDLNASEAQDFEWTMSSAHAFQWPPNHNLATPPLESPISFHQLQAYPGTTQPDRHQIFPAPMPTPTDYYPVHQHDPRSSQSILPAFQTYHPSNPNSTTTTTTTTTTSGGATQIIYHHSSGENSQSTTPTILSPPLPSVPRPTKKGAISTDIPTRRNRGQSLNAVDATDGNPAAVRDLMRRRASLSASQHHLSRSPNRSHQRRSSTISNLSPSFALPISETPFDESPEHNSTGRNVSARLQVKRSKSANQILLKPEAEGIAETHVVGENDSSGDDAGTVRPDESVKTKQARAQSEHRRREDLKQSFERLKMVLGVPHPRAGKRDLVEQSITEIEFLKRRVEELTLEVRFLQTQLGQSGWQNEELAVNGDEMQL